MKCSSPASTSSRERMEETDPGKRNVDGDNNCETIGMHAIQLNYYGKACILLIIFNSDDVKKPPKINEDCTKLQQCGKNVSTLPNVIKLDQHCELKAADGFSKHDPPMGMTSIDAMDSQGLMDNTSQGQQPKGYIQTFKQYFRGKEAEAIPEPKWTATKILNFQGKTHALVTANPSVFQNLILLLGTEVSCMLSNTNQ